VHFPRFAVARPHVLHDGEGRPALGVSLVLRMAPHEPESQQRKPSLIASPIADPETPIETLASGSPCRSRQSSRARGPDRLVLPAVRKTSGFTPAAWLARVPPIKSHGAAIQYPTRDEALSYALAPIVGRNGANSFL